MKRIQVLMPMFLLMTIVLSFASASGKLSVEQVQTISGFTTTYTLSGTTVVAIQSGSTWTNTLGITVSQGTNPVPINPPAGANDFGPLVFIVIALAIVAVLIVVILRIVGKSRK